MIQLKQQKDSVPTSIGGLPPYIYIPGGDYKNEGDQSIRGKSCSTGGNEGRNHSLPF